MDFTSPKTAQTNGITMEYFEQGSGTPVLLLHGFPEHAYSWRHQVDPVADAGFRVIVPNQRGYAGPTPRPTSTTTASRTSSRTSQGSSTRSGSTGLSRGLKHYMRTFQEPGVAEALLGGDIEHTFRSLMRGRGYTLQQFKQAPPEIQELPAGWAAARFTRRSCSPATGSGTR